jgi:hypothetical protein
MHLIAIAVAIVAVSSATITAQQAPPPPVIPYGSLIRYTATETYETVETMQLERLLLRGSINIMMDPIGGHVAAPAKERASVRFEIDAAPQFRVDFLTFPRRSFPHKVNDDTLNAYLDGLAAIQAPEREFEIVEYSDYSPEGESKFRILSRRAHQIIYEFSDPKAGRLAIAENWVELGDYIHVVKVQAPADRLSLQMRDVGPSFSSAVKLQ